MAKYCKKCGEKIGVFDYNYSGICESCHKGEPKFVEKENKEEKEMSKREIIKAIMIFVVILIFVILIGIIISNSQESAETRKQRELTEFNRQLHQDPSTWDKEQRDRYDSFIEWDWKNK